AIVPSKGSVPHASFTVELDTLPLAHPHNTFPSNNSRMQFIVEPTPGTRVFMVFPEVLTCHLHLFKATVHPGRSMERSPSDIPGTLTLAAVDTPRWMGDTCGGGLVEGQRSAV